MKNSATKPPSNAPSDALILSRILSGGDRPMTPEVARYILGLGFNDAEKARIHDLAVKNKSGNISQAELDELDAFIRAGDILAILQLKARQSLGPPADRNGHG